MEWFHRTDSVTAKAVFLTSTVFAFSNSSAGVVG
jgi:hypothetical protein